MMFVEDSYVGSETKFNQAQYGNYSSTLTGMQACRLTMLREL